MISKKEEKSKTDLKKRIDELENQWKRALADYQNLEKRIQEEKGAFVKFANQGLILKILEALDNLEKAEGHLSDPGLSLAVTNLRKILQDEGVEKIEVVGRGFNPSEMECVEVVKGEKDNEITEEVRSGYRLYDKILRAAQVKVAKREINQKED